MIFLIDFGMNSYFSYTLDMKTYLLYQNLTNMVPFFISFLSLGTPFAVVYLSSLQKKKTDIYLLEANMIVLFMAFSAILFACILYVFDYVQAYILFAIILAFFNVIKQNAVIYFLALKRLAVASFIRLNQKIVYGAVSLLLINVIYVNETVLGMILIFGEVVGFVILTQKYRIIAIQKVKKIKSILKVSRYSFFTNAIGALTISLPVILLNYYKYASKEIIVFAIAFSMLKYSSIILGPFMQLVTPYFTPLKNDKLLVKNYYKKFFWLILFLSLVVTLFCYALGPLIINLFFEKEYMGAGALFQILSFSIPFMFLNTFTMIIISSIQSIKKTFKITLIGFVFVVTSLVGCTYFHCSLSFIAFVICLGYLFDFLISSMSFLIYMKEK